MVVLALGYVRPTLLIEHMTADASPLLVTRDEAMLDDVLRICAAADVVPHVCHDVAEVRSLWAAASMVIVCSDLAAAVARTGPARRDDVFVLHRDDDESIWQHAVHLGAEHVMSVVDDDKVVEVLSSVREGGREACLIAVIGGCGGSGVSTLAAALAQLGSRRGFSSLLVDADPLGGGIDLVIGNEHVDGARWPDFTRTDGRLNGEALRGVLPLSAGLATLSWDRGDPSEVSPEAMHSIVVAAVRSHDLVVVDLPRTFDPVGDVVLRQCTMALLVVPEEIRAIGAAARCRDRLLQRTQDVAVVARRRTAGMDASLIGEALELPVIARLRDDKRVASSVDAGEGPLVGRPLRRGCARILDALGMEAS